MEFEFYPKATLEGALVPKKSLSRDCLYPDPVEISLVEEAPAMRIDQTLFFHDHVGDKKSVFLQRDAGPPAAPCSAGGMLF